MNIKMQCCGIALLLVILYFYICRKKIKLNTSMAFMRLFWVTMINLVLDTLSIVLLTYHDSVPEFLINLVCKSYISAMVLTSYFSLLYLCTDIYGKIKSYLKIFVPATIVAVVGVTLIYVFPIYKNREDLDRVYTYGPSVMTTYLFSLTFLLWVIILLMRHRTDINPRRLISLRIWMLLWICAAGTQFVFNEFLLVGFANAIGIVIIYLKLENPEVNIDTSTGLFNQEAMILYTKQCLTNKDEFAVIELTFPFSLSIHSSDKEQCLAKEELITYLSEITGAYAFKNEENTSVLIFKNKERAGKILALLKNRFEFGWGDDGNIYITPGWVYIPDGSIIKSAEGIIHLLGFAKINSKNYIKHDTIYVDKKLIDDMLYEKNMEVLVTEAMDNDRVEVYYQPIYSTEKHRFSSAEALVRIRDRKGALIPPGDFIRITENNGSILRLGEMVFEKVCKFIRDYEPNRYGINYIEVNLSVVQCAYDHLADSFIRIMNEYQVHPKYINLEITESASVLEKGILHENMTKLIDYGVKFSLDDFGSGRSNLNYIVDMPVDIVKFDRDMLISYFENVKARYVMNAAIHMVHGMELQIVSEGIETKEQFDTIKDLGVSYIQGYYFSRPLPQDEFLEFIRTPMDASKIN